ncbi:MULTISPECIES: hypothetical protein [unclassified Bacillus (in: firmicutes)]|uniref:hypothetical protein n=1 Tax=unclassified Bacillus (in: firmicutes) TaxID=185979 RepID=UPI001BE59873|nr:MULTISPECIES: hypothetical protein [unclassified Bacillus (in: firmicutes)]MBT2629926.1 hypothetical protein [Bacillus sp. ISL-101]
MGFVYAKANKLWGNESPMKMMLEDFISLNQSFAGKNKGIRAFFVCRNKPKSYGTEIA